MFKHLLSLGIKLVMNSIGHMGIDLAVEQEDVISESLLWCLLVHGSRLWGVWQQQFALMAVLYDLKLQAGASCYPYGPDWTDSALGMLPLICAVMSVLAAHPFDCTVLHKCVSMCFLSQACSCAITLPQQYHKWVSAVHASWIKSVDSDTSCYIWINFQVSLLDMMKMNQHQEMVAKEKL